MEVGGSPRFAVCRAFPGSPFARSHSPPAPSTSHRAFTSPLHRSTRSSPSRVASRLHKYALGSAECEGASNPTVGTYRPLGSHAVRVIKFSFLERVKGHGIDAKREATRKVAAYYLEYASERGQPGHWVGSGLSCVGLERGQSVKAETFISLLSGAAPDGTPIANARRTLPGLDMTVDVPKSVSVLLLSKEEHVLAALDEAIDAGVAAALSYLEGHATFRRRGAGGRRKVATHGLIGAAFRHYSARPVTAVEDAKTAEPTGPGEVTSGDPHLHVHVVLMNVARGQDDGKWGALDTARLTDNTAVADAVCQYVVRCELTRSLGVAWRRSNRRSLSGGFEVDGVQRLHKNGGCGSFE